MERNCQFEVAQVSSLSVHLGRGQVELFADEVSQIQVLCSGDAKSVTDLRVELKDGELTIEQPQYGFSANITEGHWLQISIRMPKSGPDSISLNTIGGMLIARGISAKNLTMDSTTGDLHALNLTAGKLHLRNITGKIHGEGLQVETLSTRNINGEIEMEGLRVDTLKGSNISGTQTYTMTSPFQAVYVTSVTGTVMVSAPVNRMKVTLHSLTGQVRTEGVDITDDGPLLQITGVSADLKLLGRQQA